MIARWKFHVWTLVTVLISLGGVFLILTHAGAKSFQVRDSRDNWQTATDTAGSSYRNLVTLSSNVENADSTANTLYNCGDLNFPVTNGTTYRFYILIYYTSAATTTGSRWTINGPAFNYLSYCSQYSLTTTSNSFNSCNAYQLPSASNATSAYIGQGNVAVIEGVVIPSANGTIQVRFASEIKGSTITALGGSTLEWW